MKKDQERLFKSTPSNFPDHQKSQQIEQLKNLNKNLMATRQIMIQDLTLLNSVSHNVSDQSQKFKQTNKIYNEQTNQLSKSQKHILELKKKNQKNVMMIYGSFFLLLLVSANIFVRRVLKIKFY